MDSLKIKNKYLSQYFNLIHSYCDLKQIYHTILYLEVLTLCDIFFLQMLSYAAYSNLYKIYSY